MSGSSIEAYRRYIMAQRIQPIAETTQNVFNDFKVADQVYHKSHSEGSKHLYTK